MGCMNYKTVVCIASGPSLTKADCDLVEKSGITTIAVNSSWKLAPFAHYIYAGDYAWWEHNLQDVDVPAQRWTSSKNAADRFGLKYHHVTGPTLVEWNSGLRAIDFAELQGASKIILLGFDCSIHAGCHWHGDHPKTVNPTAARCHQWRRQFQQLAARSKIDIVNCSRETAIKSFRLANLEDELCLKHFPDEQRPRMSLNSEAL
jgi:hypothetical protein